MEKWNERSDEEIHKLYRTIAESMNTDERVLKTDVWNETVTEYPIMDLFTDIVAIESHRGRVEEARARGYDVVEGSIESLPFKNEEFDLVMDFSTIDHVFDYKKVLEGYNRVLRTLGKLSVVVWLGDKDIFGKSGATQTFNRTEFCNTVSSLFTIDKVENLAEDGSRILMWIIAFKNKDK